MQLSLRKPGPRTANWIFFGWNEIQIIAELNSSSLFFFPFYPDLFVFQWSLSHHQVTQGTVILETLFSLTLNQVLLILLSIPSSYTLE